jgi:GTP-binding protein YchF
MRCFDDVRLTGPAKAGLCFFRRKSVKIGLIGLPGSGKTTIFNTLTKMKAPTARANGRVEPNIAVVKVMDERVTHLSEIYLPRKTVYATVEFVDFTGLAGDAGRGSAFSSTAVGTIKTMDALTVVIRNFEDPFNGPPAPVGDLHHINEEFLLSDLVVVENRLESIENDHHRGRRGENTAAEEKILRKILEQLNENLPVREMSLSSDEERIIRGFQFLTKKPLMVILNSDETRYGKNTSLSAEVSKSGRVVEFAGEFEMELSRLSEDEAKLFMEDMDIPESALSRLTNLAYETLGYISFFTVGSDEVRAWNVRDGNTALDAASTIHSDLARGFIRAECFSYRDWLRCGSEKGVRETGLLRLEGRDYPVQDGDILNIRFNV